MAVQLSDEKIKELREIFSTFDKDGDGIILTKELVPVFRATGHNLTEAEIQGIIKEVDADGSGSLDFKRFVIMISQLHKNDNETGSREAVNEAFRMIDKDGKSYIDVNDLRHVMMNLGEMLTEEEVNEMICIIDREGIGQVSYEDFVEMMNSK